MRSLSITIPVTLALSTVTQGLLVVPTSPQCADTCGNVLTSTSGSEITCNDLAYASSQYGPTFKACIACELNSTYFDPSSKISDLHWGIYNLRFALSWCLFGFGNNTKTANTPCLTSFSCGPLESAFEYDSLNPNASSYSYCPLLSSVSVPKCSSCLQEMGNENFLANYVTVLEAACVQQPAPGSQISIAGNVFSSQIVNITTPSATPISSYTPSSGALSLGAKIGIAVGAIIILLALMGFCIVWNGKRRRRRILAEKARVTGYEWQARHGSTMHTSPLESLGGGQMMGGQAQFFDSPQSQRPLFTNAWGQIVDDSPVSGHPGMSPELGRGGGGQFEKAYFSPYSSTYTSPVSATEAAGQKRAEWPRDKKVEPEDESGERIEMGAVANSTGQYPFPADKKDPNDFGITPVTGGGGGGGGGGWTAPQAPILSHPGNGRGQGLPGQTQMRGLSEDDVMKGHAL